MSTDKNREKAWQAVEVEKDRMEETRESKFATYNTIILVDELEQA